MEATWLYYLDEKGQLYCNDAKKVLENSTLFPDESVDMAITSPPYWALRDYHADGQLGQEPLFKDYICNLVGYFDIVYRILKPEGTLWVNIGDTYYGSGKGAGGTGAASRKQLTNKGSNYRSNKGNKESDLENASNFNNHELPERSLCQIPARFSIEMQNRGWILRNDLIWHKPNQMPSSARNRFSVDYEHLYFFTKKTKDYYFEQQLEAYTAPMNRWGGVELKAINESAWDADTGQESYRDRNMRPNPKGRNKRSVWSINTQPMRGSNHFAKYPEKLIETPILAGCPEGGTVLDIFFGSGTTGIVAERLNRKWIGVELNPDYCGHSIDRILSKRKKEAWHTESNAVNV